MKNKFSTTDLGLSAWILATRGLRLISVERVPDQYRNIATFIFDDPSAVGDDLQAAYYSGEGVTSALAFFTQLRHLKRKVHSVVSSEAR